MSQVWNDIERKVVTRKECVKLTCDGCGRQAEYPENQAWEWGSVGTATGSLDWQYSIDGDSEPSHLDLCYECCQKVSYLAFHGELKRMPQP